MHIGRYLKKLRNEKQYTQEKLAELIGVDVKTIRRIEKNSTPKENYTLKLICEQLGVPTTSPIEYIRKLEFSGIQDDNEETIVNILGCSTLDEISHELREKWLQANEFIIAEKYEEALNIYLAFNTLFSNAYICLRCGELYLKLEKCEEAIAYTDKAILNGGYTYRALMIKGYCFGELRDYAEAKKMFKEAAQIKSSCEVYYSLGVSAYMEGEYREAIDHYLYSIKVNPQFASSYLNLSVCHFNIGEYEKSFYYANRCIEIDATMYQAYGRLGEYYKFMEQQDKAIECYRRCLELDEENYQALLGLGICFAAIGNELEAGIYFKKWLMLYSTNILNPKEDKGTVLIDIGGYKTRYIKFEQEDENQIRVYLEKCVLLLNMAGKKSYIMIGAMPISDDTGTVLYPTVGKIFEDVQEYKEVIKLIKDASKLMHVSSLPIFINTDDTVKIEIIEQQESVGIEIVFNEKFKIIGNTDLKGEGFEEFIKKLKEFGQCRIHLECKEEVFVIECIKDISIKQA